MRKILISALAVVALGSFTSWAEEPEKSMIPLPANPEATGPMGAPVMPEEQMKPMKGDHPDLLTSFGMSAEVGGGVVSFLDKGATDISRTGGIWSARLLLGTRTHFAGELAYVGSAQGLNTLGLDQSAVLMSNGVEGQLRFNFLTGDWQPYAAAGYTWRHYSIQNSQGNTSSVASDKNVGEVPVSLGIAWRYKGFIADVRASLNNAFNNTLIPGTSTSTVTVGGKLGFEF